MYSRILVPIDGSPTARRGLREAIGLARGRPATLRLVFVVNDAEVALPEAAYPNPALREGLRTEGQAILDAAVATVRDAGLAAEPVLLEATADLAGALIVKEAASWPADLIVMGTHGRRGIGRLLLGSCAESVLRHAQVPVLLVRRESPS